MSTSIEHVDTEEYDRQFVSEMLQTEVFSAFYALREFRKSNVGLTNAELGRRCGWSRSQVTKLLSAPQNWTLETIAQLAAGLGAEFKFVLIDKLDRSRNFNAGGMSIDFDARSGLQLNNLRLAVYDDFNSTNSAHFRSPSIDARSSNKILIENYNNKSGD